MEGEVLECELLRKQLRREEVGAWAARVAESAGLGDHSRLRCLDKVLHPKSSPQLKLLEKIDLLKDTKEQRMHHYLDKIIKNIVAGRLNLH